ncbi:MAG: 3-deoxy-D-manno-octulosonic acid transferase [Rhodospirillaceae bacterium]|nr:MAG: 3-deoxy-D-manno-octulosonic acid transferase [Rhodospirillaceae bacterium]
MARLPYLELALYRGLTRALAVAAPFWLAGRTVSGKEDWSRRRERYGLDSAERPAGSVVWCHAASVGESLTLLPLLTAILDDKNACSASPWHVVVTTGTVTSAALMSERLPPGAVHRFNPLDHRPWVARFLDHWRPDVILWTESELWPNTLSEIAARRIPAALINARLSDKALRGWRRWPGLANFLLSAFQLILAQSPDDARRFEDLGATDVRVTGNLKLAAEALPADPKALTAVTEMIAGRPAWLAASIHPGEDAIAAQLHRMLKANHPGLLTIVVPRHPPKAPEMIATLAKAGLRVACRSHGERVAPDTDVYVADTVGELGVFYRACDLVFMGKSLAVGGGQNPAEAALLGCALVLGPDMSNFRDMTQALRKADAAVQVASAADLTQTIDRLLRDSVARRRLGDNARAFMAAQGRALAETLTALAPLLAHPYNSSLRIP